MKIHAAQRLKHRVDMSIFSELIRDILICYLDTSTHKEK